MIEEEEQSKNTLAGKIGCYISKLQFNNDKVVDVKQNDIVVFVGPNNVGKSQCLKDIYDLSETKKPSVVIKGIEIVKLTTDLDNLLEAIATIKDNGKYKNYSGLDFSFASPSISGYGQDNYYGSARPLFMTFLNTLSRLTISKPPEAINRNSTKQHPIHYAAFDGKYRKWLSENFRKAFGKDLIPNIQYGKTIPLCIGEPVKLNQEFKDEQERQEEYAKVLDTYIQFQMLQLYHEKHFHHS